MRLPLLELYSRMHLRAFLLALPVVLVSFTEAHATGLSVSQATEYPELTRAFRSMNKGWIGADGAYSVPLDDSTTLWTFGDTWIGTIKGNKRSRDTQMVNNTAAIQKVGTKKLAPLLFKWVHNGPESDSLWAPSERGSYFWPGDGITLDGKPFFFLHKIKTDKSREVPFQFRTVSDFVVAVDNPLDPPKNWRLTYGDFGNDAEELEYGTATISDDKYIYIYCSHRARRNGLDVHPAIIARVLKTDFAKLEFRNTEFFKGDKATKKPSTSDSNEDWTKGASEATVLFPDAAPEMSVTRVKGIPGFIVVYMPPLSKEIYIRQAMTPEGPWSDRIKIYDCPEKDDGILLYSAKSHQELAREPRELIVTYCRNSKDNEMHYKDAGIYFPQAIRVKLKSQL